MFLVTCQVSCGVPSCLAVPTPMLVLQLRPWGAHLASSARIIQDPPPGLLIRCGWGFSGQSMWKAWALILDASCPLPGRTLVLFICQRRGCKVCLAMLVASVFVIVMPFFLQGAVHLACVPKAV
jgi:hypothetical protein